MSLDLNSELYYQWHEPFESVIHFFRNTLLQIGWGQGHQKEVAMDVGCGPGGTTTQLVLPLFPRLEKVIAVDLLPHMVDIARKHHSHPLVEYHVADIENWSTIEQWEGQISKIVSVHCFHWVKNKRKGFENVYKLLKKDGEAGFFFVLEASFYATILEIQKNHPKWSSVFKDVENYIPESHYNKHTASFYENLFRDIGFEIILCREKIVEDVFASDEDFKGFFSSLCVLKAHVPADQKDQFEEDLYQEHLRQNGRDKQGLPYHRGRMIEVVVKKTKD